MKVELQGKEYIFQAGYQQSNKLRAEFNSLAEKVFDLSFEGWYEAGYWNENYTPYTLFDEEKAVSNISINTMNFNISGKMHRYIQIGTVMTDQNYRNKNLNRFLMEKVLDESKKYELTYLFANNSVLEMYPKYGFIRTKEYEYFKPVNTKKVNAEQFIQLDMDIQSNRDRVYDYVKHSSYFSQISMVDNADLVMFYCISFLKNHVYYIEKLDTIVIVTFDAKKLYLKDVFCKDEVELDKVIDYLIDCQLNEVVLGFSPKDCSSYDVREISGDDALFVQQGKTTPFANNKLMFPSLSHA